MRTLLLIALFAAAALPQPPPSFKANADLVMLDLVVRDKKGHPIRDLEPGDIEVFDNGEKVQLHGLRLVEEIPNAAIVGNRATVKSAERPPTLDPLRQLRLVTLVFERLGVDGRVLARQAALDLLKHPQHPNLYYAVFVIDQRLKLLQPYTNDRQALKRAIEHATTAAYSDFTGESDRLQAQLQNQIGGPDGRSLSEQVNSIQPDDSIQGQFNASQPGGLTNAAMARLQLNMLQFSQELSREQLGRSSIFPLLALVRGQSDLPGRKSVLYFTEGLYVPASLAELFQTVISTANRNNVTFYAADIRGLQTTAESGLMELRSAAASAVKGSYHDPRRQAPVTRDEATAQDRAVEAIRMNGQNAMAELAEDTGGFFIANTNDFRIPLRRAEEDITSYYELSYTPTHLDYDGHFRKIEVRPLRANLAIQSRSGYFALPPTDNVKAAVLQPFEVPLLKALSSSPLPAAVEFRMRAYEIHPTAAGVAAAVVVELPLAHIQFQPSEGSHRGDIGIVALIRDAKGNIARKIARDLPFDAPQDAEGIRNGNFVFTDEFTVPPGRYTVEMAVLDRKASKMGARKSIFLAETPRGLAMSGVMRVRDYAPHAPDLDPQEPFQFEGGRITPTLDETLHEDRHETLGLFCIVTPDPDNVATPALTVEYLQNDKLVGRGDFALPVRDVSGRIPWALFTPVTNLKPGSYEVRVIVRQGSQAVTEHTLLNVAM